jgi:translation elongation factor EF-G
MDPDLTNVEAAARIGISRNHLQHCLRVAVKEGWLKFNEPISRIEHEIIPKAIDNLNELLDNKNKVATIETVKNTVFKQYLESKGVKDAPTTVLALKIEAAPVVEGEVVRVMAGHIVGAPRELTEET